MEMDTISNHLNRDTSIKLIIDHVLHMLMRATFDYKGKLVRFKADSRLHRLIT